MLIFFLISFYIILFKVEDLETKLLFKDERLKEKIEENRSL
jgi:hypothetical protein